MIKVIKLKAVVKTIKNTNKKFLIFKGTKNDGTKVPFKFRSDIEEINNLPKENALYDLTVDTENMNKSFDDYGEVWWVRNVEDIQPAVMADEAQNEF